MSKILEELREFCTGDDTSNAFDKELMMYANSSFGILNQANVGPKEKFHLVTGNENWEDFEGPGTQLDLVKEYVSLRTKLLFDTPKNKQVIELMNSSIEELLYRMNFDSETGGIL